MNAIMNNMISLTWNIIPILLIFFLMVSIMFVFYLKGKVEEMSFYLKSIAISLERLLNRGNDW